MPHRTPPAPCSAQRALANDQRSKTNDIPSKRRGELAELVFLCRASALGFVVAKPYGDSAPYDFIVADGPKVSRVQVRSGARRDRGAWHISSGAGSSRKRGYTRRDIDLLAVYLVPLDIWYLIPIDAFSPVKTIWLRPGSRRRFESFREAWHVFRNVP
jgi:PD-(D/E)XK endonuclease